MIITGQIISNFDPCRAEYIKKFDKEFPNGLDISRLYGTFEESSKLWRELLNVGFIRVQIGWCIYVGLLPAKIRADLRGVNLSGANLSGADLSGVNLENIKTNNRTVGL